MFISVKCCKNSENIGFVQQIDNKIADLRANY